MTIAPVRRSVRTTAPPQRAFAIFTGQIGRWWPKGMTIGANPHADIVIEPEVGGRWFERDAAGQESRWGTVLAWEPPTRLLLAWQLTPQHRFDPDLVTEVELLFVPTENGGTEVRLEHRNLERFGAYARQQAERVGGGWSTMLGRFAAHADIAAAPAD